MELARTTHSGLNISSEAQLLTYTYVNEDPIEVLARVDLGDVFGPIAGGGTYTLRVYINGVLVSPVTSLTVSAVQETIAVSKAIPIEQNDVVSITVAGLVADTSVNTVATLRDATPAKATDFTGIGPIMVDHNYGGTDNLTYQDAFGAGIDGAVILVYLKTDYDAGNRANAFVVARSGTQVGGTWILPVMLDPATYTIVFSKQGAFGPDTKIVTVS